MVIIQRMGNTSVSERWRGLGQQLSPGAGAPLHTQLAGLLRDQMGKRELLPGEPLPTEAQLQTLCGVSRSVARQAMATLVAEGLVVRGRGRGTVVAPERQYHRIVNEAAGLYSQISTTGADITTDILDLRTERAPHSLPGLSGQNAVRLERLRSVNGLPVALIRTWLTLPLAAGLTAENLRNASLHETLQRQCGVRIAGGNRQVRAVSADATIAAKLGTPIGAPLLLLEGVTQLDNGQVFEHFSTWHRGDAIAFDVNLPLATEPASATAMSPSVLQAVEEARAALQRLSHLLPVQDRSAKQTQTPRTPMKKPRV